MKCPGYSRSLSPNYEIDCAICSHETPETTLNLINEYNMSFDAKVILGLRYFAPMLLHANSLEDFNIKLFSDTGKEALKILTEWKKIHKEHIRSLKKK